MGITPNWNRADVEKQFALRVKAIDKAIVLNLSYLGELCITNYRSLETYRDQTGNLRASGGYVVVKNGAIIKSDFSGSNPVGASAGRNYAETLAAEVSTGYALIVVAGMAYALAVESRGLDVLSSTEQLAKTQLPILLAKLKSQLGT